MEYNILICDDDKDIVSAVEIYLLNEGHRVLKAYDGFEALQAVQNQDIHLIIMDVMMPNMDGINALIKVRETKNIPVIMLSAKSEETDRIIGLNMGADDYITKPFRPLELLARVKSQLRRYTTLGSMEEKQNVFITGGLMLDDTLKKIMVDGDEKELTSTEYNILKLLMSNMEQVFSSKQIYETVWSEPAFHVGKTVAVHIRHLREKIEIDPKNPNYLKVIYGLGYKITKIKA